MSLNESILIKADPLKVERIYPYRFGFLNDMHVCSQYGLYPAKGWKDRYGSLLMPNDGQKYLIKKLKAYAQECKENRIHTLLCPGDVAIGSNPKERGKFVMNIELEEQANVAAKVVADFCEQVESIESVIFWAGTGYHGSVDMSIDNDVAKILRADYNIETSFKSEYSYIKLEYNDAEKMIWITHTANDASMYPEQAMGKDMMLYQEAVAQGKLPPVDMIIRAHHHSFIEVHKPSIRALQLPCWQFAQPYDGVLKNFGRFQPDIGSVIMLFDEKLRSTVWHFTYPNLIDPSRFIKIQSSPLTIERKNLKKVVQ
jgi:hypothetical protein